MHKNAWTNWFLDNETKLNQVFRVCDLFSELEEEITSNYA